jgi:hypothetical protein
MNNNLPEFPATESGPVGQVGPVGHQEIPGPSGPEEFPEDLRLPENGHGVQTAPPVMVIDEEAADPGLSDQHATQLDQAFGVKPFFWKHLPLAPFAIDREGDFMRHRELLGDAPLREVIRLPMALVPDALRVLWFCSHEPREWLMIPTHRQNDEGEWRRLDSQERAMIVEDKIRSWARENVSSTEQALAVETFYEIYQSAQSTRAISKPSEHSDRAKN